MLVKGKHGIYSLPIGEAGFMVRLNTYGEEYALEGSHVGGQITATYVFCRGTKEECEKVSDELWKAVKTKQEFVEL